MLFAAAGLLLALFALTTARAQTAPTITGIEFLSTPPQSQCGGRAYVEGDVIRVGVNFSDAVTVDTTSGTPKLGLRMCGYDRDATLDTTSSGTSRIEFTRTVANDDWACDGQSPSFRSGALTLGGGTIRSSATQTDADLANAPVPNIIGEHLVANRVHTGIRISSTPANGHTFAIGETVEIALTVGSSAGVAVGSGQKLGLLLGDGSDVPANRREAMLKRGTSSTEVPYRYTIEEGDEDTDGVSIGRDAIRFNGGSFQYGTSRARMAQCNEPLGPFASRKVDGIRPTVSSASVNGDTLTLTFSEALNADSTPPPSAFTVGLGSGLALPVDSVVVDGTTTTLTLSAPLPGSHVVTLDYTPPTGTNAEPLEDAAGNDALALDDQAVTNYGTAAGIESLAITSTPGNYHSSGKIYGPAETIAVTVTFNEAVTVNEGGGTPSLELDLSGTAAPAVYRRGSGTTELVFERVVTDTDATRHGIAIGAHKLELNGGTIRNQSGVDAGLIHAALERDGDHRVGDIVRIVDFSFEEVPAGGAYAIGDTVKLHAHFTRAVWLQGGNYGSARVRIAVGDDVKTARASGRTGDGDKQLVFDSYVVAEGDLDEDGLSLSANAVSGDIRYSTGTGAFEEHGEWSPPTPVRVDGVRPSLVGAAAQGGREVVLTFSETLAQTTATTSTLTVLVADSSRPVDRVTTAGTRLLLLLNSAVTSGQTVTVRYADPSDDDDAEAVQDLAGNDADSFSFSGTAGGADGLLSSDAALSALTLSPGTLDPEFSPAHASYSATVRNSETRVTVTAMANHDAATIEYLDASDAALTDADTSAEGHQVSLSEGDNAIKVKVTAEDGTAQTYTVTVTRDLAPAVLGLEVLSTGSVCGNRAYVKDDVIEVGVNFSKAVTVDTSSGTPTLELRMCGYNRDAAYVRGSGTAQLVFSRTVANDDSACHGRGFSLRENGLALNGGTIESTDAQTDADLTYAAVTGPVGNHLVANRAHTGIRISRTPANGHTFGIGETIRISLGVDRATVVNRSSLRFRLRLGDGSDVTANRREAGPVAGFSGAREAHYRYTVEEGDEDTDGVSIGRDAIRFNSGRFQYGSDRALLAQCNEPLGPFASHKVDGIRPTLERAVTLPDGTQVILTFSETLSETTAPASAFAVLVAGSPRTVNATTTSGATVTLTLDSAVTAGETVKVAYADPSGDDDANAVQDEAGNDATSFGAQTVANIVGTGPSVESIALSSDPGTDATYAIGDAVEATVTFREAVDVDISSGTPQIEIDVGGTPQTLNYRSGTGTAALLFTGYTVAELDAARDGIAIGVNKLTLNGGTIAKAGDRSTDAVLIHAAVPAQPAHKVDGVRPTLVTSGSDAPETSTDGTQVILTFSEALSQTTAATSTFTILVEGSSRTVDSATANGTEVTLTLDSAVATGETVTVAYEDPTANDDANDDANAVQDAAGNDAASFDAQAVTNVVEAPPSVSSVALTSIPGADATYAIGDTVRATVTFTAAVDVNATGNQPQLELDIGGTPEPASYESGSGTTALVFAWTVADNREDADGIEIGANKLTLNGGTIRKAGSTTIDALLDHTAVAADSAHKVDGVRPTLSSTATSIDGTQVILTFSETLSGTTATTGAFTVSVANSSRTVDTATASGTEVTLTLDSAVAAGETVTVAYEDPTASDDANAVQDPAGNDAASFDAQAVTNTVEAPPTVVSVALTSDPGSDATYAIGDAVRATVTFTAAVDVNTTGSQPQLALDIGGTPEQASYESGSGATALVFAWTVADNREDADGIEVEANKLTLNGGTIRKAGSTTIDADLDHAAVAADSGHKVDGMRPTLSSTATSIDGTQVILTFSETLSQTTAAASAFTVSVAESSRTVDTATASGTEVTLTLDSAVATGETVTVAYTDPSGDDDANAVQDAAGNDATTFDPQTVTNTVPAAPTVVSVALTSDPGSDATYAIGDAVKATVTFTAAVDVNATGNQPQLELDIGGTPEPASYESGSGTTALVFAWTVADNHEDADGIEIRANKLTLNGGTITKAGSTTIDAVLDHAAVAADSGHKVDGMRPTLSSGATSTDGTQVILTFSEALSQTTAATSTFTVLVANSSRTVDSATASGATVTLTLDSAVTTGETVTVAYTDPSGDDDANAVQDAAGNDAASFDPQAVTNNVEAAPTVVSVALTSDPGSDATYAIGDAVKATVTFTAAVDVNATGNQPQLELDIGGTSEPAVYESGSGTTALVFAWTVADNREDADGIAVGANKLTLNGGTIRKAGSTTIDADLDHTAVAADSGHKVDGMRPTLSSGATSTDGTKVILTFSEALSQTTAATSTFTVLVANSSRTVDSATASGATVTLTLDSAVTAGETVTVAYTDPSGDDDANAVQDAAGNDAASFDPQAVTNNFVPPGTLVLNLSTIATDDTVNIAEKAAGFAISGDTGSEADVSVSVTIGTQSPLAATSAANGAWSVNVPANAAYITESSVTVTVSASKTGFTPPSPVTRELAVDLTVPTAPTYTAPDTLQVGVAITVMNPSGGSDINGYSATGLPSGLSIDGSSGAISGTPDTANANPTSATVTVTDTAGNPAAVTIMFPVVAKGDQKLTGFGYGPATVTFGDAAPTVTAPNGARTTVSYSATPSDVCTVNPSTGALTLLKVGGCEITATAESDANYNEATADFIVTVQPAGTATVSVGAATAAEGDDVEFEVTLSGAAGSDTVLGWTTAAGTATFGDDFTAVTSGTLTIAAGDTTGTLAVPTAQDMLAEADEAFTVTITGTTLPSGVSLGTATATGTIEDDDALTAAVTAGAPTVSEGSAASFEVALTGATSTADVVVTYTVTGTANSGTDYTAPSGSLTITAGESSGTITIQTTSDSVLDSGETLIVTLTEASTAAGTAEYSTTAATTAIADPGMVTVSVAADAATVAEGTAAQFTVTLSGAVGSDVALGWSTDDGTATAGEDYAAVASGTVTVTAGTTSATFTVTTLADLLAEGNEMFTVTLVASGVLPTGVSLGTTTASGTIADDDPIKASVAADAGTVTEGMAAEFTVTLTSATSTAAVVVSYTVGGTATSGTDYTAPTPATLTIDAGAKTGTISIQTTSDSVLDSGETLIVTLTEASTAAGTAEYSTTAATTAIADPGTVTVSVAAGSAAEGEAVEFTVTLSGAVGSDVALGWSTDDGTATAGEDYAAVASGTVTVTAGTTSATFAVTTLADLLAEGNEMFTVTLVASGVLPTGVSLGTATATGTIEDDDPIEASVAADAGTVTEGMAAEFTVTLMSATSTAAVVVSYTVGGTATSGTDYTAPTPATLTIDAGAKTGTISIPTVDDGVLDHGETLTVTLSSATTMAGTATVDATAATTAIADPGTVTVSVAAESAAEGEAVEFTVTLSGAVGSDVALGWSTADGTATAGEDYAAVVSGTVTVTAGTTSATFAVTTLADLLAEGNEMFTVTLVASGVLPTGVSLGTATATGTIEDDDPIEASVAADAGTVTEGMAAEFTVTLTSATSTAAVVVSYTVGGTATSGTDYTAPTPATLTIDAGAKTGTISIPTVDDGVLDHGETLTVTLSSATTMAGTATVDATAATTAIADPGTVTVSVAADAATVAEGTAAQFTVTLSGAVGSDVALGWSTDDGTATAGEDYAAVASGTVTVTAGTTSATFAVTTLADLLAEGNEMFTVTLVASGVLPSGVSLGTATATGTIEDDDPIEASVAADAGTVTEGMAAEFTVTLMSATSTAAVVVSYTVGGTATSGTDYTAPATPATLTIGAGVKTGTISIPTVDDGVLDHGETLTVTLSSATTMAGTATVDATAATTAIADPGTVTVSVAAGSAAEGEAVEFAVTLSGAVGSDVALGWSTADGTATAGEDYTAVVSGTVTVTAGTTSATFTVTTLEDTLAESNETFSVALATPGSGLPAGVSLGTATATGTIADDEQLAVNVAAVAQSVEEGQTAEFTVTLAGATSTVPVVVSYMVGGTATAGTDHTAPATPATLTIEAGESSATIGIDTIADGVPDPGETLVVTLIGARTTMGFVTVDASAASATTTIADAGTATVSMAVASAAEGATAQFGLMTGVLVADVVGARLEAGAGSDVQVGGMALRSGAAGLAPEGPGPAGTGLGLRDPAWPDRSPERSRSMSARDLLLGSSFRASAGGEPGGRAWTAWAQVAASGFESDAHGVRMDGDVTSGFLGLDASTGRWRAGAALSFGTGEGTFAVAETPDVTSVEGTVESTLTSVYPYARARLSERVSMWGIVGYGQGTLTVSEESVTGTNRYRTRTGMRMGALGVRGTVLSAAETGGLELGLRSDALLLRMSSEVVEGMAASEADVSRVRLLVDASRAFEIEKGGTLTPSFDVGVRHDGGDAQTGTGLEVGAGLRWAGGGITIEGAVRGLVVHEESDYGEWGASGSVRIDPRASGRGWSLTVAPAWGNASGASERMWSARDASEFAPGADFEPEGRLESELGYGFRGPGGLGVVTPYEGLTLSNGGSRRLRAGARWDIAPGTSLGFEGSREEGRGGARPVNALTLRAELRF